MTTNYYQRELDALRLLEPSARKSLGEYKPVMQRREGGLIRTEVLARAASHNVDGNRTYARGLTFPTRDEAVAYAEQTKQARIADVYSRAARRGVVLA